ncbi:MAG TPA: hypothetical protein VN374_04570 [Desulfitobacteriaceae bacterium]|nr:hypothetical protein [Desulfitobacteriaceae bacterium]
MAETIRSGVEVANRGRLIDVTDPQPEVRKNAETARDWAYRDEAIYLYGKAVLFIDRFIDPLHHLDRNRLPEPVIAFENLRNKNTLAAFRLTRSPEGLQNVILLNTEHYIDQDGKKVWEYGRWAQLETLLHEQVHEWQQVFGKDPVSLKRIYHNKEFVDKCESLGLHPKLGEGYHLKLADWPFAILMRELGIEPPKLEDKPEDLDIDWFKWLLDYLGKSKKGTSTLTKWECPECGLKVRLGIKGDPELVHDACSEKLGKKVFLIRADGLTHQMNPNSDYKMPDKP